jgi:hypothetical protein
MRPWLPSLLCLLLPLAACSGGSADAMTERTGLSALLPDNPLNGLFTPSPLASPWPEDEAEGPALRLTLGRRSAGARMVHQQGARQMWRTRSGVVVALDGARVVATSGLPTLLAATRFDGPDPLAEPLRLRGQPAEARRVLDLMSASREPAGMRFGVALQCRLSAATQLAEPSAEEDVEEGWLAITERCRADGLRPITNRFWADPRTGEMLYSEQWVGPGLAYLRMRHLAASPPPAPAEDTAEPPEAEPQALPTVPGPEPEAIPG